MRIQHNIMAMSAYRNYTNNVSAMKKNLEKLSSGYKINRAGDDAAGLAISEKMRAQITGLETAQKNAKDGISLVQTAEGALTEVHDMLNRMVELATQSANGTYDDTTDRAQMQKEIDQLLEEIDRIADSSNFNGINLLDGTLGLNTDAFGIEAGADAVEATMSDWEPVVSSSGVTDKTELHFGASQKQQDPAFQIDFSNYEFEVEAASSQGTAGAAKLKVAFAGVTATLTFSNSSSKAKAIKASDIATALAAKFAATAGNTYAIGTTGKEACFEAAADGGKVNFTFIGLGSNASSAANTTITTSIATALNAKLDDGDVVLTLTKGDGTTALTPTAGVDDHHTIHNLDRAQASDPAGPAGINVTISSLVSDGNELTIDGQTFIFKTKGSDSVVTATGSNVIDVSAFTSAADQLKEAVAQLSHKTAGGFHIGVQDASAGIIHICQEPSDMSGGRVFETYDQLKAVVSGQKVDKAATAANVKLTVTDKNVKDGNTLNIDGKKYVFSTKPGANTSDTTYIKIAKDGSGALSGLEKALTNDGYTVAKSGSTLTISAKSMTGDAPTILGKGLTLQIGDTSDDFNQLNVAVNDCHAQSLGVGGLDISSEEAAQQAIAKIKDAVNFVSDVRGTLGATQNRLDHTINNLSVMTENIQDAESTIRDVDIAEEMMAYTKNNILIQSAQAMLAQANQVPQGVLQLLG